MFSVDDIELQVGNGQLLWSKTALHIDATQGRNNVVDYLMEHDDDVHVKDGNHERPLLFAINSEQEKNTTGTVCKDKI